MGMNTQNSGHSEVVFEHQKLREPNGGPITNHEPRSEAAEEDVALEGREPAAWQETIHKVARGVVSIKFCHPYSFDTGFSSNSEATGFVVDAERGYVLTNRHVVGPGPFWGYLIFHNQEEVDAYALYRDPIHDFGILRFDPNSVKYMEILPLELRPDLAKVGAEIKVIGNDCGERLSILSGYISRLDRNAPKYSGYNDFNTCYYQANASAKGGSSGSPVTNIDGQAIAIQAGGRSDGASTDYFLPLHGPLRALQQIQRGEVPARGDIQCRFLLKPYDECRRLGLTPDLEAKVRELRPEGTSMLVVQTVLPEGPADEKLKVGDILIEINAELATDFLPLETMLDANIGQTLQLLVQRGGKDIQVDILVRDIQDITPSCFLAASGISFHNLSYQVAQRYAIACKGVYVSESASLGLTKRNGLVIQSVNHKATPNLDKFIEVWRDIPDKTQTVVLYKDLTDLEMLRTKVVTVNRHWPSLMKMVRRNDVTGLWDFEVLAEPLPRPLPSPSKASFHQPKNLPYPAIAEAIKSFVRVKCVIPLLVDGYGAKTRVGMGLVVDASKGVVLVSRAIVPNLLCEIEITIAESIVLEGEVLFLHPSQNYSVIQYDPQLVDADVRSAIMSTDKISQGASALFVGNADNGRVLYTSTVVTRVQPLLLGTIDPPRYRPINMDFVGVDTPLGNQCSSGVLMTTEGEVQAFWMNYELQKSQTYYGVLSTVFIPVLSQILDGITPKLRILPVEFEPIKMVQAKVRGVSSEWVEKVEVRAADHQLFTVKRSFQEQVGGLEEADILLTLNGELITEASMLDIMYWNEVLEAQIVRGGQQLTLQLHTILDDDVETVHLINLCGATFQRPHRAIRQQIKKLPSEVYVASRLYGSPAARYALSPTTFITHINDIPTPDLDSVIQVSREIPDNIYFRVRGVSLKAIPFVITIKKNEHYFPTTEWLRDSTEPLGWRRMTYEEGKICPGESQKGISC
ncbi:trypsin-like cysteine/serine peptidase domain-containing protein [Dactylonectria macrodidyma]|uniref:Pro-apoptotic serine protease NMA111 n=1 Tax=Dactylonectria macrodidyma TaxID=307937 RepID=A0A9P9EPJ5_9HYPO|nr:trypsin-like cysteine/serine peptidase domain-containing protein [Dactylonectria macrodidyma]